MANSSGRSGYEEALDRLIRSGWRLGHRGRHVTGVGVIYTVVGVNGENQICTTGMTLSEAWHRAVEQAAACGMLAGWPRPSGAWR
jgi:hypothetical protein